MPDPEAHDCRDDTAPTNACLAPFESPDWADLPSLLMLLNALPTEDFESVVVLTDSSAFLNSVTHESLQRIA